MMNSTTIFIVVRAISALMAAVELGLNSYVVYYAADYFYEDPYGDWGVNHNVPAQIAFLLFASIWSLLVLAYLIVAPIYLIKGGQNSAQTHRNRQHRLAIVAADLVTAIFWMSGWIALAKLIGGPTSCVTFCAAVEASVAFAAGLWAAFAGSAIFDSWQLWRGWKAYKHGGNDRDGVDDVDINM